MFGLVIGVWMSVVRARVVAVLGDSKAVCSCVVCDVAVLGDRRVVCLCVARVCSVESEELSVCVCGGGKKIMVDVGQR
jgi:hypothetical protein